VKIDGRPWAWKETNSCLISSKVPLFLVFMKRLDVLNLGSVDLYLPAPELATFSKAGLDC